MPGNDLPSTVQAILDITGDWTPGAGATEQGLAEARAAITHSLAAEVPAAVPPQRRPTLDAARRLHVDRLAPEARARLEADVTHVFHRRRHAPPAPIVSVRTGPIPNELPHDGNIGTYGMKASQTLGPFVAADGLSYYVDIFTAVQATAVYRGSSAQPFLMAPFVEYQLANRSEYILGAGSLWMDASLLGAGIPATCWTGFRIKSGKIVFSEAGHSVSGGVRISANATCDLTVELDPPAAPPPQPGPGGDASSSSVTLPAHAAFRFTSQGAQPTSLDKFSVTLYSATVESQPSQLQVVYWEPARTVLIQTGLSQTAMALSGVQSTQFIPGGSAPIIAGGWALPIVVVNQAAQLGEAAGAGSVGLLLGPGFDTRWVALAHPVRFAATLFLVAPGTIACAGLWTPHGEDMILPLWRETATRRSSITLRFPKPSLLLVWIQPGSELLLGTATSIGHFDRPVRADGRRFRAVARGVIFALWQQAQRIIYLFGGQTPPPEMVLPAPLALDNALLRVFGPGTQVLAGQYELDGSISSGILGLGYAVRSILFTLPDPYASNVPQIKADAYAGALSSFVVWKQPDVTKLSFLFAAPPRFGIQTATLLDLSTHADQLGVRLNYQSTLGIGAAGLSLIAAGSELAVFTVPEISWEPMEIDAADIEVFFAGRPPNDGGGASLQAKTVKMAPMSPAPLLQSFLTEAKAGTPVIANLTLPFGIKARIEGPAPTGSDKANPLFNLVTPVFDDVKGGLQVAIRPNSSDTNAVMPGSAHTEPLFTPNQSPLPYGVAVLGGDPARIFDNEFADEPPHPHGFKAGVPLLRYDLCGYGASVFSDWREPGTQPGADMVLQAKFNVFVGRTAYEVVQVQTYLYPWAARMVRTITIERLPIGRVTRHDSGWQAATPGIYSFPYPNDFPANRVHPGAFAAVRNIRRVRETQTEVLVPPGATYDSDHVAFRKVLFDADVEITGMDLLEGGFTENGFHMVPARDLEGWLQTERLSGGSYSPYPARLLDVAQLLSAQGPSGGAIACTVRVGGAGPRMKIVRADVSASAAGPGAALAGALRGAPELPRQGAWSVVRRVSPETAPAPLDPNFAVPVIRNSGDVSRWHIAEPADVLSLSSPKTRYGLLQDTGTQKLLLERPQVPQGQKEIDFPDPPRLADPGALLAATGIFPDVASALEFRNPENIPLDGSEFTIDRTFPVKAPSRKLIDFGALHIDLEYKDKDDHPTNASVILSPTQWQATLEKVRFALYTPLGSEPLVKIIGRIHADSGAAASANNLDVIYGSFLDCIQKFFSNLQKLTSYLPGKDAASLKVSFVNGKLTVRDSFALPDLPLGVGKITDIAIDIGLDAKLSPQFIEFTVGIGSEKKPFHWLCFPLSGTGVIAVGARNGDILFLIRAGIGAGVAIDVGVASGSASIVVALQVDNRISPFLVQAILTGQASVDVLGGLVSASLTLSAALGISPQPLPIPNAVELYGSVGIAIHISILWIIDIDFDGSWDFSQRIESPITITL